MFNLKCTTCHDGSSAPTPLILTTWSNTVADPSVVFPYQPENSKLVWRIDGRSGYEPMPPVNASVAPLTQNQVNGIITWIKEGAKNN